MFIDGFSIFGFRSFGVGFQRIGPCQKVNILIGRNNSGKSNVLTFLAKHFLPFIKQVNSGSPFELPELDSHQSGDSLGFGFGFGVATKVDSGHFKGLLEREPSISNELTSLLTELGRENLGLTWFEYSADRKGEGLRLCSEFVETARKFLANRTWQTIHQAIYKRGTQSNFENAVSDVLKWVSPQHVKFPEIAFVPAFRQIKKSGGTAGEYCGVGLIEELAKLQQPSALRQGDRESYSEINRFVQSVTGDSDARLEIPFERDGIVVHMNERALPLSSLGTGIHEVVILASMSTVKKNQIVCIEEPELHLHPELQRKLIQYLQQHTSNQYFITTHSAQIIDTPGMAVFRVSLEEGCSKVTVVLKDSEKWSVCKELGYKASDILQANCVIWVEGPSDRVYLLRWIAEVGNSLKEGVNFAIMFYGGRLLSHLSVDANVEEFIDLIKINRNVVVVMDSDKKGDSSSINATKLRMLDELNRVGGMAWVTAGREVENYLSGDLLKRGFAAAHPNHPEIQLPGQFEQVFNDSDAEGAAVRKGDKVKVAREVSALGVDLNVLDLRDRVQEVVKFIERANHFDLSRDKLPWPVEPPSQVKAVFDLVREIKKTVEPAGLAVKFSPSRVGAVKQALDTLLAIGLVCRSEDGRYSAS